MGDFFDSQLMYIRLGLVTAVTSGSFSKQMTSSVDLDLDLSKLNSNIWHNNSITNEQTKKPTNKHAEVIIKRNIWSSTYSDAGRVIRICSAAYLSHNGTGLPDTLGSVGTGRRIADCWL